MKPLVSILIPAYNAEAWISDTLRCAIAQTWERKEIIVNDDGSTDRTLAIARQYESDQLRVVTHKNEGAAATRNKAYPLCRGRLHPILGRGRSHGAGQDSQADAGIARFFK